MAHAQDSADSLLEFHRQVAACWRLDPFTAYDVASLGLEKYPNDLLLQQKQAHALARTGSLRRAQELLEGMVAVGHSDAETLGLLGRVWKDLAAQAISETARTEALRQARHCYASGLASAEAKVDPHGYYPGINAATLSVLLGQPDTALDFARRTEACAQRAPHRDYWLVATLAEVALIRGDLGAARQLYTEAAALHPAPDQLASTRRQARLLAQAITGDAAACDPCFRLAPITLFIGHLTDAPDRPAPRFPESMVPAVRERIRACLAASGSRIGYASAARGGDLLFLQALQEIGAETQVVLALERDAFRHASVDSPAAPEWRQIYEEVLGEAKAVRVANRQSSYADSLAFDYATRQLIGLAKLRARQLDVELRAIVLWDGQPGDGSGGTAWGVQRLLQLGIPVENIHPQHAGPVYQSHLPADPPAGDEERAIRAILFSDCKGYSKLREEEVVDYTRQFLSGVSRLMQSAENPPLAANTWGDGLFMVFREVSHAGEFALRLRDGAARRAGELGLPLDICLRIGLHAGPVSPLHDPVTKRPSFAGVNLSMAARIEPITRENQIYTSEPFAALCAEAGLEHFNFEYLGSTRFAKDYGTLPLYQFQLSSRE